MVLESLLVMLTLLAPRGAPDARLAAGQLAAPAATTYSADERAVGNWRIESAFSLDIPAISALRQVVGAETGSPPRCVKLNNYWCVKHAGWYGEIAADPDGHVAFSRAEDGAAVAALLLRRYYIDYKRHTAREIASRWAPSQCYEASAALSAKPLTSPAGLARMLPQRPIPMGLAPHGLANTLRARWLAAHGRGEFPPKSRVRPTEGSAALNLALAPAIAPGMGEPPHKQLAAPSGFLVGGPPRRPIADCPSELMRINNYAEHIAEGVASGPDQDLTLFDPAGRPTENLPKVMANMAAVEIGPFKAHPALVSHAVEQLRRSTGVESATK